MSVGCWCAHEKCTSETPLEIADDCSVRWGRIIKRAISMAASQQHMHAGTSMGAQLVDGGATFRTWAPAAKEVYLVLQDPGTAAPSTWQKNDEDLLVRDAQGYWGGFFPGVTDGTEYRFWVVGDGSEGFKRDPY